MQFKNKDYDPTRHDRFKALTVKQPFASWLIKPAYKDKDYTYALQSVEIRSKYTNYRGDLLICSSKRPVIKGYESGVTCGLVELYDIKPVSEMTEEDWAMSRIPKEKRTAIKKGFAWMMRNPRRVIEFPIRGQLGIYNLIYTKDIIIEYPHKVILDKKAWKAMNK